jgi:hypothetical protein
MAETLNWPRRSKFTDATRGIEVIGPDVTVEVPDEYVEQYLSRGFERVEDQDVEPDVTDEDQTLDWDDFQAMDYEDRVQAVQDGQTDEYLDRVVDEDSSKNVRQAAEARQDDAGD